MTLKKPIISITLARKMREFARQHGINFYDIGEGFCYVKRLLGR